MIEGLLSRRDGKRGAERKEEEEEGKWAEGKRTGAQGEGEREGDEGEEIKAEIVVCSTSSVGVSFFRIPLRGLLVIPLLVPR